MIVPHVPVAFSAPGEVPVIPAASLACSADACTVAFCFIHSQNYMLKCTALRPYLPVSLPFLQLQNKPSGRS